MAERTIEIPEIKLDRITVKVVGTSPLLTNRFGENAVLWRKRHKPVGGWRRPNPREGAVS